MTDEKRGIAAWVESHLWAIIAAGIAAYSGYLTGMTTMGARIDALETKVANIDSKQAGRTDFMVCAVRNFDKVFDKLGVQPACPMKVPE